MSAGEAEPGHPFLEVERVEKSFDAVRVLQGVDLQVERGELLALLGPSGSGKSTLLRIIAGFETADRGSLLLEGSSFTALEPQVRGFGMVFQSYALFPHLSVFDNVAFGLAGLALAERAERVESMLELVQLSGLGARGIDQISGGQQQRVALARALAPRPKLLLLDEPLSNLDPSLRDQTRRQLRSILRAVGITSILVTHEQEEAFELGDRVAVLDGGRIEQVGTPLALYREPETAFVAGFVGRSNSVATDAEQLSTKTEFLVRPIGWDGQLRLGRNAVVGSNMCGAAKLWVRPEHLTLTTETEGPAGSESEHRPPSCCGEVVESRLVGPYALVAVALSSPAQGVLEVANTEPLPVGCRVRVVVSSAESVRLLFEVP